MQLHHARRVLLVALVLAALAALATALAGAVLAEAYRPGPAFSEAADRPPAVVRSRSWTDRHELATALFVATSAVAAVASLLVVAPGVGRRRAAALVAGPVVALGAAFLTMATRSTVQFEQLAIYAVAVASDLSGYWYAAFDDGVRFVVLDGAEVGQGTYAAAVVVHLAAPVVGLLAMVPALALGWRAAAHRPETTTT